MEQMIEAIRAAVADDATAEQKATGAQACRTILSALDAEPGKAIALPGTPAPSPLAGISPDQALDLLIARLSTLVAPTTQASPTVHAPPPERGALRIAFVQPPARPRARRR